MNATFRTEAHVTGIRRGSKAGHRSRAQSADTSVQAPQITAEDLVLNKAVETQVAVLAGTSAANLLLDFRTATAADNREDKLIELLDQLYARLYAGDIVEMTWP